MLDWILGLLNTVGLTKIWRAIKWALAWLKPSGLAGKNLLVFTVGETDYVCSYPYVPEREVSDIIVQINLGNPNLSRSLTVMTFSLQVGVNPPYPVSEAHIGERGGWYLVPLGGGFSMIPDKDYIRLPVTIPAGEAAVGWIGFCLLGRTHLTLKQASHINATVIAIQADGSETSFRLPVYELPFTAQA